MVYTMVYGVSGNGIWCTQLVWCQWEWYMVSIGMVYGVHNGIWCQWEWYMVYTMVYGVSWNGILLLSVHGMVYGVLLSMGMVCMVYYSQWECTTLSGNIVDYSQCRVVWNAVNPPL